MNTSLCSRTRNWRVDQASRSSAPLLATYQRTHAHGCRSLAHRSTERGAWLGLTWQGPWQGLTHCVSMSGKEARTYSPLSGGRVPATWRASLFQPGEFQSSPNPVNEVNGV